MPGNQERRWQTEKIKTFLVVAEGQGAVGLWGFSPDVRRFIRSAAQKGKEESHVVISNVKMLLLNVDAPVMNIERINFSNVL